MENETVINQSSPSVLSLANLLSRAELSQDTAPKMKSLFPDAAQCTWYNAKKDNVLKNTFPKTAQTSRAHACHHVDVVLSLSICPFRDGVLNNASECVCKKLKITR